MKYLKVYNETHSIYEEVRISGFDNVMREIDKVEDLLNANLIKDLIDLSLDLVDDNYKLFIIICGDNFPKLRGQITFNHDRCAFTYLKNFLRKKDIRYEFHYAKNLRINKGYREIVEIEKSIKGMYPNENIFAV